MKEKITYSSDALALMAVEGLLEKKGENIVRMDLRDVNGAITDYFVVASGTSDRHVQALADSVEEMVRKEMKDKPINIEGRQQGEWVLLDYVNVVVHVFLKEKRAFYDIEGLWADAEFHSDSDEGQ